MNKNIASSKLGIISFFFGLMILEYFLFRSFMMREIIRYYPLSFDQTGYLLNTYHLYHNIVTHGLIKGIEETPALSTGILFPIQAVLIFMIFGVSRFHALLLNFVYFAVLQVSVFFAAKNLTKNFYLPFVFLGILLCVSTGFLITGGMADFRMDFIAFCLYGVFVSTVVRSQIFYLRNWSVIAGIVASLLILIRPVTMNYIGFVLAVFFFYILFSIKSTQKNSFQWQEQKNRLYNLIIMGVTNLILAGPLIYLNWVNIYNYYIGNQVLSSEKYVRQAEVGVTNFVTGIAYYPKSVVMDHIGILALSISLGVLLIVCLQSRFWSSKFSNIVRSKTASTISYRNNIVFIGLSIFIPLILLTLDVAKSPIVGNVIVVPFLWLIFLAICYFNELRVRKNHTPWLIYILAGVVLVTGITNQVYSFEQRPNQLIRADLNNINRMDDDIGDYAIKKGWTQICLSDDRILDAITSDGLSDIYFETHKKFLEVSIEPMGGTIFPITLRTALQSLNDSNVVILSETPYHYFCPYPFNASVTAMHPLIEKAVKHSFVKLGDYYFRGFSFRVYVRKN